MKAYERLINYAKIWTVSDEANCDTVPSTQIQFDLAHYLEDEMNAMGLEGVRVDKHCYVYGYVPATAGYEDKPTVGFIAHLDTAPDFNGKGVNPQIIENYDGGDIAIGAGRVLEVAKFPHLKELAGHTLITTDGTSLLGADDKAGVAEIMTLAEILMTGNIPHGRIAICFAPDEEIGHGASLLDIEAYGADFAYTLDGGMAYELECENFNACAAHFDITGFNIHPGDAKDKMINAGLVAMEINASLPAEEIPARTCGYQGFYHLTDMAGEVSHATLDYIVRDFDPDNFERRQARLREIESQVNEKYGDGTCELTIRQQYRNMVELVSKRPEVVKYAKDAIAAAGFTPVLVPIRGGTDGAQLTYRGLVCPNLGVGGYAFHGPYEHISAQNMDDVVSVVLGIVRLVAQ